MNTIEEQWEEFAANVVPDKASDAQRTAMKLAFYSGAFIFHIIQKQIIETNLSKDATNEMMNFWDEELKTYLMNQTEEMMSDHEGTKHEDTEKED